MAWTIRYTKQAERQLKRLSPEVERRLRSFMEERVTRYEQPRVLAKRLTGAYEDEIRYRVGDYRIICRIQEWLLVVLVVEVGHRREIYRKQGPHAPS